MGVIYVEMNGTTYAVIQCANCDHRTPAGQVCPMCQPNPTEARCIACYLRGPIPTETTTIAPEPINDPPPVPTTTATVASINDPPGPSSWAEFTWGSPNNSPPTAISNDELRRIAKRNPPPAGWQQDDSTDPTT